MRTLHCLLSLRFPPQSKNSAVLALAADAFQLALPLAYGRGCFHMLVSIRQFAADCGRLRSGLIALAFWIAPLSANAEVLWERPQATTVCNQSVEILQGALPQHDDNASGTLYFKMRVNPLSDVVVKAYGKMFLAGMVFCKGDTENLGIGDAWTASGYGAFSKAIDFGKPHNPGEFTFTTDQPEAGTTYPYLSPRSGALKTIVVRVDYIPGALDRLTIWLDPELGPGATEANQPEKRVNHLIANASFDQIRLVHRGAGPGWVFDEIVVATSFGDFVPIPLWRRPWFLTVAGITLAAVVAGGVFAAERRRASRQMALFEREQAVTAERVRIAQDLHDDLGAKLTEIVLLGEVAMKPGGSEENPGREMLQGLRELHSSLDEAVWSINPRNDSLTHLIEFVSEFGQRFSRRAGIEFHLDVAGELPEVRLSANQRHNVLLAVKEAINNVVKHAHATKISLHVSAMNGGVRIAVCDDGCGMESSPTGDGLRNMPARMSAIGGTAQIRSEIGKGTEVVFELPLKS